MVLVGRGASVVLAVLCLLASRGVRQDPPRDGPDFICGRWRVQGVVATSPFASAADVVKPFFGAEAVYLAGEMRFGSGVTIARPVYRHSEMSDSEFETTFQVSFAGLRIKGAVAHIVEVRDPPDVRPGADRVGTTVVVRNENQILVPWEGHFLDLARAGPPCASSFTPGRS